MDQPGESSDQPGIPHATGHLQAMAVCGFGLESVVARELHHLGFADAKPADTGSVRWQTDEAGIARANLWLRTADRVLIVVDEFEADSFDALFEGTKAVPWADWIAQDAEFPVRARCVRSQLSSVPAVTRAVKKAVAESLLAGHGASELPETGPMHAIQARLLNDRLTLLLDTSGEALHKRGYRREGGPAPLRETLAAAMLSLTRWRPHRPLVDPFCGSGTIPIEAALIATNTAPGLTRHFDAEQWGSFPPELWDDEREQAEGMIELDQPVLQIAGYDLAEEALVVARRNAERAGVRDLIHFQQRAFGDLRAKSEFGLVVTNPPYGVRLDEKPQAEAILRSMPGVFRRLPTWSFGLLTDHDDFEHLIGQPSTKRRKLYNGSIQCTLHRFDGPRPPRRDGTVDREPAPPAFGVLAQADENRMGEFEAVFAKRWRHLRKWPDRGIEAYRVYDHDVPAIPIAIDRLGSSLVVGRLPRGSGGRSLGQQDAFEEQIASCVQRVSGYEAKAIVRATCREPVLVTEHNVRYEAGPNDRGSDRLDLELRDARQWLAKRSAGQSVLSLFCGGSGFTIAAAAGGAAGTLSIDASEDALDCVERQFGHNGIEAEGLHELVCCDVKDYLADAAESDECFDIIAVELPTSASTIARETDWNSQRDHTELLHRLADLLMPGGVILLVSGQPVFRLESPPQLSITETSKRFCPEDFRSRPVTRSWLCSLA